MLLSLQRKGKKLLMNEEELQEYMSVKLNELAGLLSNMAIALIMTSLLVVFTFLRAGDMYYLCSHSSPTCRTMVYGGYG